ncbi:SKP1-interacting partner 15-like [Nymphaea colorata]|uniref:SKP1-interacting partner 15-like n=1 Tax=Nymphaea colorata TaxID=210225 RepID=UPI00129E39CC|nr:SKP1-interacting partner 15-like [Nymphaea colorata]
MELTSRTTIHQLPVESFQQILSHLSLREIFACRAVCRLFKDALTCPFFLQQVALRTTLNWFVVHPSDRQKTCGPSPDSLLQVYDADSNSWVVFPLDFLPFTSAIPVAASAGLLYLWCESESGRSLVICNPFTRTFRVLPQLGSAWFRHGAVLSSGCHVLVFDKLAALYLAEGRLWSNVSSGLLSKPRSAVLVGSTVYALCDVGSAIGSQWKLVFCKLDELGSGRSWDRLEQQKWGEILDILHRPRLIRGKGESLLMVGGLKSSFTMSSVCSTIIILQLDLPTLEWDEAGRMPADFFECFQSWGKFKVFGMGDRVFFSGKGAGKLAMWDSSERGKGKWTWVSGVTERKDGLYRGFSFDARIHAVP